VSACSASSKVLSAILFCRRSAKGKVVIGIKIDVNYEHVLVNLMKEKVKTYFIFIAVYHFSHEKDYASENDSVPYGLRPVPDFTFWVVLTIDGYNWSSEYCKVRSQMCASDVRLFMSRR
jgi:hypothetical protein